MRDHGIVGPFCYWRCTKCGKAAGPALVPWCLPCSVTPRGHLIGKQLVGPVCPACDAFVRSVLAGLAVAS